MSHSHPSGLVANKIFHPRGLVAYARRSGWIWIAWGVTREDFLCLYRRLDDFGFFMWAILRILQFPFASCNTTAFLSLWATTYESGSKLGESLISRASFNNTLSPDLMSLHLAPRVLSAYSICEHLSPLAVVANMPLWLVHRKTQLWEVCHVVSFPSTVLQTICMLQCVG